MLSTPSNPLDHEVLDAMRARGASETEIDLEALRQHVGTDNGMLLFEAAQAHKALAYRQWADAGRKNDGPERAHLERMHRLVVAAQAIPEPKPVILDPGGEPYGD